MDYGVVKSFSAADGFGYIEPDAEGPDVFVDAGAIERAGLTTLAEGQRIGYELFVDKRSGRFLADALQPV